jgi:hypothetical protein
MKYKQPRAMSREELEHAFDSGDEERIREALICAFYTEDAGWLAERCVRFAEYPTWPVRQASAEVLGNLAATQGSRLDLAKCLTVAQELARDECAEVRMAAEDALEDVRHTLERNHGPKS